MFVPMLSFLGVSALPFVRVEQLAFPGHVREKMARNLCGALYLVKVSKGERIEAMCCPTCQRKFCCSICKQRNRKLPLV